MVTTRIRPIGVGAAVAMLALLVVGVVFYLPAGLVAPGWAVLLLGVVWLALFVLGVLWFRPHPGRVLALPVLAMAVWIVTLTAGEALLGWRA